MRGENSVYYENRKMCYLRYLSTYSPDIKNLFGVTASNYDIKTLIKEEFGRRQQYIDVIEVIVVILKYTIRRSTDKILGPDTLTKKPIPERTVPPYVWG